jgi:hypothetical protein
MYVEITSRSETFDSRGKRPYVNTDLESVEVIRGGAEYLGPIPWRVALSAVDMYDYGPAHSSGAVRKHALVELTPDDVRRLLTALEATGLLTVGLRLEMTDGSGGA